MIFEASAKASSNSSVLPGRTSSRATSRIKRGPRPGGSCRSRPPFGVLPQDPGGLLAQDVPLHGYAAHFERFHPQGGFGALVEAGGAGFLVTGGADEVPDAGPGGRAQAHRARLRAGDELVGGQVTATEVEGAGGLLGYHDRDHLRVEDGAARSHDEVHAGREQAPALPLEDRGPEGPAGPVAHVEPRELDHEAHPVLDGPEDAVRATNLPHPIGETERYLG